ncbi:MAG: isochorismatase family protein [Desulfopila sp.]
MKKQLQERDGLLVVDMQNDFVSGSLAVPGAQAIIDIVNRYIDIFEENGRAIFASRDYHPADHISFRARGGPWPPHCVAGTDGAGFPHQLRLPPSAVIISKGTTRDREAYSALEATSLADQLERRGIDRVFVCGLATDYCVLASARDLLTGGFEVVVLTDGIKAVDVVPGDGDRALQTLTDLGATSTDFDSFHS